MNRRTLLRRLSGGWVHNVAFSDISNLLQGLGLELIRINGSHHIFSHAAVEELINLQQVGREAKPYQIRQFLRLVERYNLHLNE